MKKLIILFISLLIAGNVYGADSKLEDLTEDATPALSSLMYTVTSGSADRKSTLGQMFSAGTDLDANGVISANSVALTTDTTGNYAGGDAEAGSALTGDAAVDFFGAGVTAVTDATTCTDIEGTKLSITGTTLNVTETDSVVGAITGLIKANGAGTIAQAVSDTDYDSSITNEINTITTPDAEATAGLGITFADTGIMTITELADTITFDATEVDGSTTNEINTITTPDAEATAGLGITFADTGIMTITELADTITFDATEVDGSTTNEINTATADDAGSTSGLAITIAGGGINATTSAGDTIIVTGTEADTLATVLGRGADGNDVDQTSLGKLEGFDAGVYLDMDADGVIDLTSDGTLELHSADWDISTTGVITDASLSASQVTAGTFGTGAYVFDSTVTGATEITLAADGKFELNPTPSATDKATGDIVSMTVDVNTVGIGGALHMDTDSHWVDADMNATTSMPCMALALGTTGTVDVLLKGIIKDTGWAWTVGGRMWVSTAGTLTQTAPSGDGDQVQYVGIALTSDTIYFNPSGVLVEVVV